MGYMGFGMQKWIYNQRPRKLFGKRENKGGFDSIDSLFSSKDLNIEGRTIQKKESREELLKLVREKALKSKVLNTIIVVCLIVIMALLLYIFKPWSLQNSSNYIGQEERKFVEEKIEAFNISMEYGKYNLSKKAYSLAINDFNNALSLFPENSEALIFLTKSYLNDCLTNNNNCENAILKVEELLIRFPENAEFLSYKISIEEKIN